MKKKNLLMMALSVCMVGVVAVGGTLAYMTASAKALTNTFTFAEGMTVTLAESWNKDDNQQADEMAVENGTKSGYDYTNVVPGQKLYKAPTITLDTDVDAYVFVRVTVGTNLSVDSYTSGWTKLENIQGLSANQVVYYKAVAGDDTADGADNLGTIFTTLNVDSNPEGDTLGNVEIEVAAIQQTGFTGATAVQDAYKAAQFQAA